MIEIALTGGHVALVDDGDFELVSRYKWRAHRVKWRDNCYAIAHTPMVGGKRQVIRMHRLIMNAPPSVKVDHRDFDGLNNQRFNLRLVSDAESSRHTRRHRDEATSQYRGVSLDKRHGTWKSQIKVNDKIVWLGQFADEKEAAKAYDSAARSFHGDFAVLNFQPLGAIPEKEE